MPRIMIKGGIWRNTEVSNMFLLLKLKKNCITIAIVTITNTQSYISIG